MFRFLLSSFLIITIIMYVSGGPEYATLDAGFDESHKSRTIQSLKKQLAKPINPAMSERGLKAINAFRSSVTSARLEALAKKSLKDKNSIGFPEPNPYREHPEFVYLLSNIDSLAGQKNLTLKPNAQIEKPERLVTALSRKPHDVELLHKANMLPRLEPDHWNRNRLLKLHELKINKTFPTAYVRPHNKSFEYASNVSNVEILALYKTGVVFKGRKYRIVRPKRKLVYRNSQVRVLRKPNRRVPLSLASARRQRGSGSVSVVSSNNNLRVSRYKAHSGWKSRFKKKRRTRYKKRVAKIVKNPVPVSEKLSKSNYRKRPATVRKAVRRRYKKKAWVARLKRKRRNKTKKVRRNRKRIATRQVRKRTRQRRKPVYVFDKISFD